MPLNVLSVDFVSFTMEVSDTFIQVFLTVFSVHLNLANVIDFLEYASEILNNNRIRT